MGLKLGMFLLFDVIFEPLSPRIDTHWLSIILPGCCSYSNLHHSCTSDYEPITTSELLNPRYPYLGEHCTRHLLRCCGYCTDPINNPTSKARRQSCHFLAYCNSSVCGGVLLVIGQTDLSSSPCIFHIVVISRSIGCYRVSHFLASECRKRHKRRQLRPMSARKYRYRLKVECFLDDPIDGDWLQERNRWRSALWPPAKRKSVDQ